MSIERLGCLVHTDGSLVEGDAFEDIKSRIVRLI